MGANWVGGTFNINEGLGHRITNAVGNGIVGGGISAATGGDFGEGFIASAFAAAFKPLTFKIGEGDTGISARINRTAFAAMIGGTASALGGGKFANGAASAAFTHWHNGEENIEDVWNRQAVRGTDTRTRAVGDLQTRTEYGPWRSMDTDVPLPPGTPPALAFVADMAQALHVQQYRDVTTYTLQQYNVYQYDTVYDLVNGHRVNEQIYFDSGRVVDTYYTELPNSRSTSQQFRHCIYVITC